MKHFCRTRWTRFACGALLTGGLGVGATVGAAAESPRVRQGASTVVFSKPAGSVAVTPGARPGPQRVILGDPYVTTGFIRKELPTKATGTPYVSAGVLKMETDPRGDAIPAAGEKPAFKPHASMQRRIQQVCGAAARNVEVVSDAPQSLRVRFQVRSLGDAEKVSREVLNLPELLPYQVAFEVQVGP